MELKKKILFISGPTAIGKSKFAIKVSKLINGEIINADSMQVYKDLKILTARPTKEDQVKIKHHLYGHKSGKIRYNVFDWCKECSEKIHEVVLKNKIPIVVGGTGLYFLCLINGINNIPSIPEIIKKKSALKLKKHGLKKFYDITNKIDSDACSKIKKNDLQRLKHIWEVFYFTKIPLSNWKNNIKQTFIENYNYKFILILPNKKEIYSNCNIRFLKMIEKGVVNEVAKLKEKEYDKSLPIMKAHGVPEIIKHLNGEISYDETVKIIQKKTRNYVKRQITWWRGSALKPDQLFDVFPRDIDLKNLYILKNLLID